MKVILIHYKCYPMSNNFRLAKNYIIPTIPHQINQDNYTDLTKQTSGGYLIMPGINYEIWHSCSWLLISSNKTLMKWKYAIIITSKFHYFSYCILPKLEKINCTHIHTQNTPVPLHIGIFLLYFQIISGEELTWRWEHQHQLFSFPPYTHAHTLPHVMTHYHGAWHRPWVE